MCSEYRKYLHHSNRSKPYDKSVLKIENKLWVFFDLTQEGRRRKQIQDVKFEVNQ